MAGSNWDFSKYAETGQGQGQGQGPENGSPEGPLSAPEFGSAAPPRSVDYAFGPPEIAVTSPLRVGRPPVLWLVACMLVAVAAALVAWRWGESLLWAVLAWVASGPIAIGLLAAFNVFDTRARARAAYSRPAWVTPAYVACLVLCGIAICASSLQIAVWVGRQ